MIAVLSKFPKLTDIYIIQSSAGNFIYDFDGQISLLLLVN